LSAPTCERRTDHKFEQDTNGVERCVHCQVTWAESVRGFGLAGDLPGYNRGLSEKLNREAGPPIF
jgi:hypothetical protein